jgi:hypothetical protein
MDTGCGQAHQASRNDELDLQTANEDRHPADLRPTDCADREVNMGFSDSGVDDGTIYYMSLLYYHVSRNIFWLSSTLVELKQSSLLGD